MKIVPTIDQIAGEPALARDIPGHVAESLLFRCLAAQSALAYRLLGLRTALPSTDDHGSKTNMPLSVKQAAERLGIAKATLYRRSKSDASIRAMVVNTGTRKLLFSEAKIRAFLEHRTGSS